MAKGTRACTPSWEVEAQSDSDYARTTLVPSWRRC